MPRVSDWARFAVVGLAGLVGCAEPAGEGGDGVEERGLELVAEDPPVSLDTSAAFFSDLAYGEDERQVVDLLVPDGEGPFPVLLQVHGGGFTQGDEDDLYASAGGAALIDAFLAEGVAFANVEYRLLEIPDDEGVIKPLSDVRTALQFLRHHSAQLSLDPERIVGRGVSAGAGSVMWLAVHDDMADPDAEDPVLRESSRLRAAVAIETQATYDLVRWEEDVFAGYGITLDIAASLGVQDVLLSFYGIRRLSQLYEEPTVSYRADVDMMGLMSADDPPLRVQNTIEEFVYPSNLGLLYHHPFHARFAAEAAEAAGVEVQAVIPELDIDDSEGETDVEFALRQL